MFKNLTIILIFLFFCLGLIFGQTNSHHIRVKGYTRSDGTYVQPYFRTAPNSTNRDNFSTRGNVNPYTGKPGWIDPDSKYNTFYYNTYSYSPSTNKSEFASNSTLPIKHKNRTYIEDEHGVYTCYLTVKDERTFNIYDMNENLILYLVINHRGDWRIFDVDGIYIKTIFVTSEK
jgi:hypothetical protein